MTFYLITMCYFTTLGYSGPQFRKTFQECISHIQVFIAVYKSSICLIARTRQYESLCILCRFQFKQCLVYPIVNAFDLKEGNFICFVLMDMCTVPIHAVIQ